MDAGKAEKTNGREHALALAKQCASLWGCSTLFRPTTKSESHSDWVVEADGIGRIYFKSDQKTRLEDAETQRFDFKKRTRRKRTDVGEGTPTGDSGAPTQQG